MANTIANEVTASEHVLKAMLNKGKVDFELIVPNPVGERTTDKGTQLAREVIDKGDIKGFEQRVNELSAEETSDFHKALYDNLMHHAITQKEFAILNWGTTDVASETRVYPEEEPNNPEFVYFETAYEPPLAYLKALSAKYPKEKIELRYASQMEMEKHCGHLFFLNGQVSSQVFYEGHERKEFACDVVGVLYDDYISEDEDDVDPENDLHGNYTNGKMGKRT